MTKRKPFRRYALVDKSGKTRMTCTSDRVSCHPFEAIRDIFNDMRKGMPVPEGWKILDRGPVEPPAVTTPAEAREIGAMTITVDPPLPKGAKLTVDMPAPAPEPRPFQVGDTIALTEHHWLVKEGRCKPGDTFRLDKSEGIWLVSKKPIPGYPDGIYFKESLKDGMVVLVEAGTEPKAPAPEPRQFKVGDRVKGKTGHTGPVCEGMVFAIDAAGDIHFTTDDGCRRWARPANLQLVAPAQPLAPLDPQVEKLLNEARETIRNQAETIGTLTDERNKAQAGVANLRCRLDEAEDEASAMHERRVKDCVAVWLLEAADNADKVADRDARKASEFGLPRPSSCDIVAECAKRLRRMARDLFAVVKA